MAEVTSILDKQEQQATRDWLRALREVGPDAMKEAMDQYAERRQRLRANPPQPHKEEGG